MLTIERNYRVQQAERIQSLRDKNSYRPTKLVVMCAWCRKIKITPSKWAYVLLEYKHPVSHGCCPHCYEKEVNL